MAKETVENLCQKAQDAISQRKNEEAQQFYLQALGLRPDNPNVHYGLATVKFLLQDLEGAVYHFKEVTRLDPLRAGAYVNLGAVYNRLERFDEAIPVLRRGIQLDMNRAEGYYNLGLVYRRKGQFELAIQAYREATRVNPRMADAHFNIANIYLEKTQYGLAIAHYRQALEIRPNWEKALRCLEKAEAAQGGAKEEAPAKSGPSGSDPAPKAASTPAPPLDPGRLVDPLVHGELLRTLHLATNDSETRSHNFLQNLVTEIDPAIKELSSCLLYPDSTATDLEKCVKKFEAAVANMRTLEDMLQTSIERVRMLGDQLLKS